MSAPRPPRRLGLIAPWALFALAALGWLAYWFILKDRALHALDAAAAAHRAAGGAASWRAVSADGFPMRLSLRFTDLVIAPRDQAWRLAAPKASLHVNPVDPTHVIGAPDAAFSLTRAGIRAEVSAREAGFSVRMANGSLARASIEARDLVWKTPTGATRIERLQAHLRPDARTHGAAQLALELDGWRPPSPPPTLAPLGPDIARLRAAIVVESYETVLNAGLRAWGAAGGAARVEYGEFTWGPAVGRWSGRLTLDAAGRPAGALALTFADPEAAFAPLIAASPPPAAAALRVAASGPPGAAAALDVTAGVVSYAGILPLLNLPSVQGPAP